jgi:tetratricopeptide (TPR) repeat protein/O-antigen ligase
VGLAFCGILLVLEMLRSGQWKFPRLPFEIPLLAFVLVAMFSTVMSWRLHDILRWGIFYEGLRVWIFTLVNSLLVIYLPLYFSKPLFKSTRPLSIWTDIVLALVWGLLWCGFHSLRDPDPMSTIWDTYGGFLWGLGVLYAVLRVRDGEALEFFHVIFAVSLLAAIYGLLQYFGKDVIWASLIQPYGGRPVSTFGNPNFLSPYMMMISVVAFAFSLKANKQNANGYLLVSAVAALSVLCTLTRSTYVGLIVSFFTFVFLLNRAENKAVVKRILLALGAVAVVIVIFPKTPVTQTQSPLARLLEIGQIGKSGQSYGSWDQRILIWSSAWEMVKERFVLGKGWGCFELFYPFYQGKFMFVPKLASFRTHANNAHNALMEIWSQVGTVGTGVVLWMAVAIFVGGWMLIRREKDGAAKIIPAALLSCLTGMIADNFFGNVSFFFAVPAFLFWWIIGALFVEAPGLTWRSGNVHPIWGRGALLVLLAFFCGVNFYFYRRWREELFYFDGFKQSRAGLIPESIKSLEAGYAAFQGDVNNNYELGNSYGLYAKSLSEKGFPDESKHYHAKAAEGYSAALRANPGYDEIYFNRGISLNLTGQPEEAAKNLRIAMFINPLMHDAYSALGNVYLTQGKPKEAAAVYEQGAAVYPTDKDFWNNLGYTYSQMNQPEKSFEAYKNAVKIDPTFAQGWHNFQMAAHASGRKDPLLEVPQMVDDIQRLIGERNYAAAKKKAERVIQLLPDNGDAYLSLGNVLFYMNDRPASIAAYKKAIELKPNFTVAYLNLSRLFLNEKSYQAAREQLNAILSYDSNNADAKNLLNAIPR